MKFIMTQTELERAVQQYVRKLIPGLDSNTVIEPEFKATRGADGFTAEVDILSPEDLAEAATEKAAAPEISQAQAKTTKPAKEDPKLVPTPAHTPTVEEAGESVNQGEEPAPAHTEDAQQNPSLEEGAAPAPAIGKRPLFGIRQPS